MLELEPTKIKTKTNCYITIIVAAGVGVGVGVVEEEIKGEQQLCLTHSYKSLSFLVDSVLKVDNIK
jgi:hypothetical protein